MLARVLVERRKLEAELGAGVGAKDRQPACVRQDRDPPAVGQRLGRDKLEDVAQLLQRVCADHAGLLEQRSCGPVGTGQGGRV